MKPLRSRAPWANWFCQQVSQTSRRRRPRRGIECSTRSWADDLTIPAAKLTKKPAGGPGVPARRESPAVVPGGAALNNFGDGKAPRFPTGLRRISSADADQFFVVLHVDDFELLGVHARIGAKGKFAEVTFLHFDKMLFVLGAQPLQHGRVHHDAQLEIRFVPRTFLEDFLEFALDFNTHGDGAFDLAA